MAGNTINIVLASGATSGTATTEILLAALIEGSPDASKLVEVTSTPDGDIMHDMEDSTFILNNGHRATNSVAQPTETVTFTAGSTASPSPAISLGSVARASRTASRNRSIRCN